MKKADIRIDYFYSLNSNTNPINQRKLNPNDYKQLNKFKKEEEEIKNKHNTLINNQKELDIEDISIKNILIKLLPYQIKGVNWMYKQEKSGYNGGILADEMGLGKTLQTISLIGLDEGSLNLVICPVVSMNQWVKEIEKYGSKIFKVLLYYGNINEKNINELIILPDNRITVIITSFGKIENIKRRLKEDTFLTKLNFKRIIIDEAHILKTVTSSTTRAINTIKSKYKWLLTGTPIQNRLSDLYSLTKFLKAYPHAYYFCKKCKCESLYWLNRIPYSGIDYSKIKKQFCTCGHFSAQHFSWFNRHIQNPIKKYGHTEIGEEVFKKLENITKNLVLRRTKDELIKELGLPIKQVKIARLYFSNNEKQFYDSLYKETKNTFNKITESPYGGISSNYISIFSLLQRMRMAVNHPILVTKEFNNEIQICGFCGEEVDDPIISFCNHVFCREEVKLFLNNETKCPICKIKLSINLLEETNKKILGFNINPNNWISSTKIEFIIQQLTLINQQIYSPKVLIFSQFVNFLELLRWRLDRAGFRCVKIYGNTSLIQRQAAIKCFNENPEISVFLISLKAGGLALNLTEASYVFIADLWWNPSVEDQAMDRIHRIGQNRPIKITKIIIEDSIESRVLELQKKKKALFDSTIDGDFSALGRLSEEDLIFLFN